MPNFMGLPRQGRRRCLPASRRARARGCYLDAVPGASLTLRHGTRLVFEDGLLARVIERSGFPQVELGWEGRTLVGLEVNRPNVLVRGDQVPHALFGRAHPVMTSLAGSEPV